MRRKSPNNETCVQQTSREPNSPTKAKRQAKRNLHVFLPHQVRQQGRKVRSWMSPLRRKEIRGKRQSGEVNAALPRDARSGSHLLYAVDENDSTRWLIDGGALWSILPPTSQQRNAGPNAWKLQAANGSDIPCYGLTERKVCIADREFDFTFIIADVRQSILGADFLNQFYLAPNHCDKCLIDLNDMSIIPVGT